MSRTVIDIVKVKLENEGFTGLYHAGECGCECSDLAPCGEVQTAVNGFPNGCKPGYKHLDPRNGHARFGDFAVWDQKEPPTMEQWESFNYN